MALISITSHHHSHRSHNTLTIHKSEVISRQIPALPQQFLASTIHGTRVTVRDLFGNMPVRVKQRAIIAEKQRGNVKDWEDLKRDVVSLLLAWKHPVALTIRDSETNQKLTIRPSHTPLEFRRNSVSWVSSILAQGSLISYEEKSSWLSIAASTPNLAISGAISLTPVASKQIQFISLGIQPIMASKGQSVFHDEINRLFSNSHFGTEEAEDLDRAEQGSRVQDGRYKANGSAKEPGVAKKGVDRWPMFYINIQLLNVENAKAELDEVLDGKGQSLSTIMELLQAIIVEFLRKHYFCPRAGSGRRQKRLVELTSRLSNTGQLEMSSSPNNKAESTMLEPHVDLAKPDKGKTSLKKHPRDSVRSNVKLPSFRKGVSASESPFDNWSRIKQGTTLSRSLTPINPPGVSEGSKIIRPSTTPPVSTHFSSFKMRESSSQDAPRKIFQTLLSKEGQIVRAPFEDTTEVNSGISSTTKLPISTSVTHETAPEDGDDVVVWINPITKIKSVINQRTGLPVLSNSPLAHHVEHSVRLSTRLDQKPSGAARGAPPSPWVRDLLNCWDNPIFASTESLIPRVAFGGFDAATQSIVHGRHHHYSQTDIDRAFKGFSSGISGQISKDALRHAEVVSQVDMKFILVKLQSSQPTVPISSHDKGSNILVLIDQHAADERIRVESLMEELCASSTEDLGTTPNSSILTNPLESPLYFEISSKEIQLLQTHRPHFVNWGIVYSISAPTTTSTLQCLTIHSLPPSILERCKSDPCLVISLIRAEIWKIHESGKSPAPLLPSDDWPRRISSCPQGILDLISSRACRSAIMFNDELSREQCELLVMRLAECKFPFQCAHGRPSLVPLVDVNGLGIGNSGESVSDDESAGGFGRSFRQWRRGGLDQTVISI